MRLSSRLSDKSQSNGEVETFIDWAKYTMTPEDVTDEVHLLCDPWGFKPEVAINDGVIDGDQRMDGPPGLCVLTAHQGQGRALHPCAAGEDFHLPSSYAETAYFSGAWIIFTPPWVHAEPHIP